MANLQTDAIKLDMDLIRNLDTSLARRQIVKSLVNLSREMGLLLVAEGIETQEELRVLEDIGVRYVQGYLFAQPQIGTLPHVGEIVPALRSAG